MWLASTSCSEMRWGPFTPGGGRTLSSVVSRSSRSRDAIDERDGIGEE